MSGSFKKGETLRFADYIKDILKEGYSSNTSEFNLLERLQKPTFSIHEYEKQKLDIDEGVAYYLLKYSLTHD